MVSTVLLALALVAQGPAGAPAPTNLAVRQLEFAEDLSARGDDFSAITEFRRARFFYPALATAAERGLAHASLRSGDFRHARVHARSAATLNPAIADEMGYVEWLALAADGLQTEADRQWRLLATSPVTTTAAQALLARGVLTLRHGALPEAASWLGRASRTAPGTALGNTAASMQAAIPAEVPEKSQIVAGLLAIAIPGAGQIYGGRTWEGLGNFALTSLFVYGAYNSWRNDGRFEFWLLPVAAVYFGGISRSAALVSQYNERAKHDAGAAVVDAHLAPLSAAGFRHLP